MVQTLDFICANNYELIIVDDDSPDLTWQVVEDCAKLYPQIKVVRRLYERDLSTAVIRGWQIAQGQLLGVIDGDLQHPPDVLFDLLNEIKNGADLAIASRHVVGGGANKWCLIRRFLSRGAQLIGLMILPKVIGKVSDPMSGYFIVRREAISNKLLKPVGYKILIEILGRCKIKEIVEVPYVFQERGAGNSKVNSSHYVNYIHHLIRLRFSRKARLDLI